MPLWREMDSRKRVSTERLRSVKMTAIFKSCLFKEPVEKHKIENDKPIQTNEEWFDGLRTETKARIMHLVYIAGYTDGFNGAETIPLRDIKEWLKQPHGGGGE